MAAAAAANTTATAAIVIILDDLSTWDPWYKQTRASIPLHLWRYFDSDMINILPELLPPVRLADYFPLKEYKTARQLDTRRKKN